MNSLSKEDVTQILKIYLENEKALISNYKISPKSDGNIGYLGNHLTLTINFLENDREKQKSFFVKTCKVVNDEDEDVDFLMKSGIFQKETNFYSKLVEDLRKSLAEATWCPRYYFSKSRVLVLEDLSERKFEMAKGNITLDEAHVKVALRSLSRMHSASILLEMKKARSLPLEYPYLFHEILYNENQPDSPSAKWISWQVQDLLIGIELLNEYNENEKKFIKEKFAEEIKRIYVLSKQSEKYRNVLTHGDLWKNNLMFQYMANDPRDCKFVDFQFMRYAPPAYDVMHFLHIATKKSLRDEGENWLLEYYFDNLSNECLARGKNINSEVTKLEFFESCAIYKELALIQSLLSLHYILGTVTLNVEFKDYQNYEAYLSKHRSHYMRYFFRNESYVEKVKELLCELIDNYIMKHYTSAVGK